MKYIFTLLFTISTLYADIAFKETRYMAALDIDRDMAGNLNIIDDVMTIKYSQPSGKTITYYNDKVTILESDDTKTYTFEEYPQASYLGLILKAIIKDNYISLEEVFKINIDKNNITLEAKPMIQNNMEQIEIIKKDKKKTIIISMSNKDKITIETIN